MDQDTAAVRVMDKTALLCSWLQQATNKFMASVGIASRSLTFQVWTVDFHVICLRISLSKSYDILKLSYRFV